MRTVNPYTIRLVTTGTTIADKQIVLPLGNAFDGIGQNEQIEDYVSVLADDAINPIVDYEKMRYSPVITSGGTKPTDSTLQYDFFFYGKPKWDDYKITKKSPDTQVFDWNWGAGTVSNDNRLIIYPTPTTFKYNVVGAVIKWSLKSPFMSYEDWGATKTQNDIDNTILTANEIKVQYEINNTAVTIITTPGFSYNNSETIVTPSSSIMVSQQPGALGIPPMNTWNRNINISGKLEVNGISPGDTITIQVRTDTLGVEGNTSGYEFTYEGSSQPTNEELYTSYPTNNIPSTYIEHSFKGYTNSFFRLDFYDSVLEEAQNLLFTDIMTVSEGKDPAEAVFYPKLTHNGATQNFYLYWLKDDPIIKEKGYRDVWMIARFFNAATGQVTQFMNIAEPAIYSLFPTINQYQTLFKYTKVRLYEDYTYMICQRHMALDVPANSNSSDDWNWMVEDSGAVGSERLILIQIRTKS
tara:strand:+ start:1502 stop:2902 length:1401 start_codon:yes stop_codon:yes gene_type:complete